MTDGTSDFRRYMDDNQALPPDCMLGYTVWYGVNDAAYDAKIMEQEFLRLGLNDKFLPGAINPADAFEKASKDKKVDGFKYPDPKGTGHTMQIMVREAARTDNQIVRRLWREEKNEKQKELDHVEVGELIFYRPKEVNGLRDHSSARTRASLYPGLSAEEHAILSGVIDTFDASYARFAAYHDGQRVRKIIRDYLKHLNAILLKPSGGVYFVHATRAAELENLRTFLNGLNPGSDTSMVLLPLPDLGSMREEVTEAFEREAEKELLGVVDKIDTLLATRKGPIRDEAYKNIHGEYEEVMIKASEYARTLQVSQDRTGAAAEIALMKLTQLQEIVLKGERE